MLKCDNHYLLVSFLHRNPLADKETTCKERIEQFHASAHGCHKTLSSTHQKPIDRLIAVDSLLKIIKIQALKIFPTMYGT
jgi:hypothetical protein